MLRNIYKLLILAAGCAGVYYYLHTNHIDIRSFFSSCDCHSGSCAISKNPTLDGKDSSSEPVEHVTSHANSAPVQTDTTPEPTVDAALTHVPEAEAETNKTITAPAVAGKITPPKLDSMEKPVSTPATK